MCDAVEFMLTTEPADLATPGGFPRIVMGLLLNGLSPSESLRMGSMRGWEGWSL